MSDDDLKAALAQAVKVIEALHAEVRALTTIAREQGGAKWTDIEGSRLRYVRRWDEYVATGTARVPATETEQALRELVLHVRRIQSG